MPETDYGRVRERWHRILCPQCGRVLIRTAAPFTGTIIGHCRSSDCKVYRELTYRDGSLVNSQSHQKLPVSLSASVTFVDPVKRD